MSSPQISHAPRQPADLHVLLKRFTGLRILVVGDLMLDVYRIATATRISPEAPVPVLLDPTIEYRLGGAGAVAAMCAALGAEVSLAGILGTDSRGQQIQLLLKQVGVEFVGCQSSNRVTTTKERICGVASGRHRQQICRIDLEDNSPIPDPLAEILSEQILNRCVANSQPNHRREVDFEHMHSSADNRSSRLPRLWRADPDQKSAQLRGGQSPDLILVSDYAKGVCVPRILRAIRGVSIPVIVDPPRHGEWTQYTGWQALVPNRQEANGQSAPEIRRRYGLEAAIVKLDEQGCAVSFGAQELEREMSELIAARPREVHDVTGAGDQFLAVLGCSRAAGANWLEAANLANLAAGRQVERHGCVPVTLEQLQMEVRNSEPFDEVHSRRTAPVRIRLPPSTGS